MNYQLFLQIIAGLSRNRHALFECDDMQVQISIHKSGVRISTPLYQGEEPPLRWQARGGMIKVDPSTGTISLIQELPSLDLKYLTFKVIIEDFLSQAAEWRNFFIKAQ